MKLKRILIIVAVCIIFCICFYTMNKHYDILSRYPYDNEEAKELIRNYMNEEEIGYIIEYSIAPESFIDYIKCPKFNIYHVSLYRQVGGYCFYMSNDDVVLLTEEIISKTDKYEEAIKLLEHYRYNEVLYYLENGDPYNPESTLIINPEETNILLDNKHTISIHIPYRLENITDDIQARPEVIEAYNRFCELVDSTYESKKCGGIKLEKGYISYDDYEKLYQENELNSFPGHNEHQTGLALDLNLKKSIFKDEDMIKWLKENLYTFNFDIYQCDFSEYHIRYK